MKIALLLCLIPFLSCTSLGGSGSSFRVPVSSASRVADIAKAAVIIADVDGDGFVDNVEWILVGNVMIAEIARLYSTTR